jgi:hypothetical protein
MSTKALAARSKVLRFKLNPILKEIALPRDGGSGNILATVES